MKKNYLRLGTNQKNSGRLKVTLSKFAQSKKIKIFLNKDGTIQFEALENTNNFKRFYSELAGGLQEKLSKAPNNQKLLRYQ